MRVQLDNEVDAAPLAAQLSAALGASVAVSVRNPGQKDAAGNVLPGVVVLLDANTGNPLPDADPAKVSAVLAAAPPPLPVKTPARGLVDALNAASSLVDIKAALLVFAGAVADREDQVRFRGGSAGRGA